MELFVNIKYLLDVILIDNDAKDILSSLLDVLERRLKQWHFVLEDDGFPIDTYPEMNTRLQLEIVLLKAAIKGME